MKIGVFDSGIGGNAIAQTLEKSFPEAQVIVVDDRQHAPYGTKKPEEIKRLTIDAVKRILDSDAIVIACNTASAYAIDDLRAMYPDKKFVGIEPMLKLASLRTKSNVVAVCATPATLKSERYHKLKNKYCQGCEIIEPDCSNWANMIESNSVNHKEIEYIVDNVCERAADVIVLGCTHYHWIKKDIQRMAKGKATVLEPSDAISSRVRQILKENSQPA